MKIIDRKKNIFKLSQGEYVAVEKLENVFLQCQATDAIWVYGNSFESTLVAVAVPNEKALMDWASSNGEDGDFTTLCKSKKAHEFILAELSATGKKAGVSLDIKIFNYLTQDLLTLVSGCLIWCLRDLSFTMHLQVKGFEQIRGVHLEPQPFDVERDLTTPTYKLKRPQLLKYYQKEIDSLYASMKKQ
jgi:long-chain acyl-CoA synthetase